jgi:valyl-tRNA synthetase
MDWVVNMISAIRSVRAEMNVPPATLLGARVKGASAATRQRLARYAALICANARLQGIAADDGADVAQAAQVVVGEATVVLPLAGVIDLDKERARLKKEIGKLEAEVAGLDRKLGNAAFVAKAPPEVIEENRERRQAALDARAKLSDALARIA